MFYITLNNSKIFLRRKSSDLQFFIEIFSKNNYKSPVILNLNPDVIIDLGSNNGLSIVYFKTLFPDAKIIGVEPDLDNFKMAIRNTEQFSNVYIEHKAIWSENIKISLIDNGKGDFAYSVIGSGKTKSIVEGISMEDIIGKYALKRIDILKIDIEGAEREIFSNGSVEWLKNVRCIIIELHDWLYPGCSEAFFKALVPHIYSLSHHSHNCVVLFNIDE